MSTVASPWEVARRPDVTVRSYAPGDAGMLGEIFHRAVHKGNHGAYTDAQETVVAGVDGRPVGFMTLDLAKMHVDLLFVLPEMQGRGVADAMYLVLESRARLIGATCLTCDASHLAKPFLIRHGWDVVSSQTVERQGVTLENWRMEKRFPPNPSA